MTKFRFNKLVRDKLPSIYIELNQKIVFQKLKGKELLQGLKDKLIEEAAEVPLEGGTREQIISELSDVQQVVDDMKSELAITDNEIDEAKKQKLAKKGGFSDGIFVESIELDDNDEWVEYYRKEPLKYPEIRDNGKVDPDLPTLKKGKYRHNKSGKLYEVTAVTFHTETNEPLVLYKPLYKSKYEIFARPHSMFIEEVELHDEMKPRFEEADD